MDSYKLTEIKTVSVVKLSYLRVRNTKLFQARIKSYS